MLLLLHSSKQRVDALLKLFWSFIHPLSGSSSVVSSSLAIKTTGAQCKNTISIFIINLYFVYIYLQCKIFIAKKRKTLYSLKWFFKIRKPKIIILNLLLCIFQCLVICVHLFIYYLFLRGVLCEIKNIIWRKLLCFCWYLMGVVHIGANISSTRFLGLREKSDTIFSISYMSMSHDDDKIK